MSSIFMMVDRNDSSTGVFRGAYYVWAGAFFFSIAFTLLIWLLGSRLQPFMDTLLPDQGASWYYWKIPVRDFMTMFAVWVFYLAHQFSIWAIIYRARRSPKFRTPGANGLSGYNVAALGINILFIFLHLFETHLWFDGLAQDVPIWTSQYSVIIMLVVVLIIENQRRGLFLGRRAGRPFTAKVSSFFSIFSPGLLSTPFGSTRWLLTLSSCRASSTCFYSSRKYPLHTREFISSRVG
jgi:hypothetical protein